VLKAVAAVIVGLGGIAWLHKDPRGETAGPYGYFTSEVRYVNLRFKCLDVAAALFEKSFGVSRQAA
jgi:hypothetical protein